MAALGAGTGKIEIIGDLRYSEEGRRNGVPVAGLRLRYLVAKLGRLPVLGVVVQWILAALALPHLLRHQRATEASLAVRFGETARALRALEQRAAEAEQRDADLRSDLIAAVEELSDRLTRVEIAAHQLRQYVEGVNANVAELRQLTLTMNHWTVQVRRSIDAIETAEAERRAHSDEAAAAMILAARTRDAQRTERLAAWGAEIAARIPRGAVVIDLGIGSDWLATLVARGFDASAIETNAALHREARERGLGVTLGIASALLARTADASLDALTIAATSDEFAVLLAEAQRIVKRGGCLMVADVRAEAAQPVTTPDSLEAAGFGAPKRLDAFGGRALFVTRA
jgi:O-antigen chain-terminating methyltransferase